MLTLEQKLEQHRLLKQKLTDIKAEEMILRVDIVEILTNGEAEIGTHNFDYPGLTVKLGISRKTKVDKFILDGLDLTPEEDDCVRWTPSLDANKYKKAGNTDTLDEALIVTLSAPTLTVELSDGD